ncbi:DEAD-box ATP-dependent RNA helicase ISE2, chloroplastic [Apostasia shenzhenica]|uniref:DEAD-box ATP-dependent RNA helicase ISE2, chloroplastic n=1 Tax=Apostasia shenzhenica TaxID=1088818 RepID=A0A2I0B5I9_9ASPA|nr:DEAD-box ATP-dependent RNA helicase ISE2, chloroplastic [Apostasia shenzhenica]
MTSNPCPRASMAFEIVAIKEKSNWSKFKDNSFSLFNVIDSILDATHAKGDLFRSSRVLPLASVPPCNLQIEEIGGQDDSGSSCTSSFYKFFPPVHEASNLTDLKLLPSDGLEDTLAQDTFKEPIQHDSGSQTFGDGVLVAMDVSEDEEGGGEEEEEAGKDSARPTSRYEEHKWQRVERLIAEVREFGEEIVDFNELAGVYDFPIDKFQRLAIQAFLRGSSVVVSAPTSSGKTLIAEAAAVATVAKRRRLFYTTPLKALSNQKYREFRTTFGEHNVGLLTGDSVINKDAQILIMTTEILRNMMYQSIGMVSSGSKLFHVDVVVLDEVHYLSDISRGTVWEEIVIYCPKEVQLICLSATVANPDELAGWIEQIHGKTELVTSTKRPVPLEWHFSLKNSLWPLLDEKGTKINRKLSTAYLQPSTSKIDSYTDDRTRKNKFNRNEQRSTKIVGISKKTHLSKNDVTIIRRSQVPQIKDTLRHLMAKDMLPAIWFIFSRRGCDAAVQYLEDCMLLDECETSEVELELCRFRKQYPDAIREVAVKGLLQGVSAHHAGCLPLWKSFVEELFQRGLVKVVFATETLAAGINMPARTAVISSLSKRGESGRTLLSSNELLQMAGRAGRRGIDEVGHVVLIQTPYEGAEESCELLFAGLEPLVSQFTASYGMVLNLLAGTKITRATRKADKSKAYSAGRTLEEARKLVEQSFGNYVGSNVMLTAKEELGKIRNEVHLLSQQVTDDALHRKCQEQLLEAEYTEISSIQEELRAEKRLRTELRQQMELQRMAAWKSLLDEFETGQLPFICLQYKDSESVQRIVSAVYMGMLSSFYAPQDYRDSDIKGSKPNFGYMEGEGSSKPAYYVALGSDNSWYIFTEKWIKMIYKSGLPNSLTDGVALPRENLRQLLVKNESRWEKLVESEFGSVWSTEGSLETWSWSLNVPVLGSLSEDDEVKNWSQEYQFAVECYRKQRTRVARLKKELTNTKGFKEFKKVVDMVNYTKEKIERLEARSHRLTKRIVQIEPSGWKEFLQIGKVIQESGALDVNTHVMYPLGETASAIRGENELWLAMVLRNKVFLDLKPAQFAAVIGSLVSEGIKIRPWKANSYIYEPSSTVNNVVKILEEQRSSFLQIQDKYGVKIACGLDSQFSGMVEAWASGLTWRELMMDCAMDDGDLARLLRRTIDLLAQIPKLPDIDPEVQNNALVAANVMDRAPISELAG